MIDLFDGMRYLAVGAAFFIAYRLLVREKKDKTKEHYTKPGKMN